MGVNRVRIKLTNDNVEATNFQEFGMAFDSTCPLTPAELSARVIDYFCRCNAAGVIATDTRIEEVLYRPSTAPGYTSMPWPAAELAALETALVASPTFDGITTGTAYGSTAYGSTPLAPLGTSISVSEITPAAGRSGRGRHFLPFIGRGAVDSAGLLTSTVPNALLIDYMGVFLGVNADGSPIADVDSAIPVVSNAAGTSYHPVTLVKAQRVFSNLESRRR